MPDPHCLPSYREVITVGNFALSQDNYTFVFEPGDEPRTRGFSECGVLGENVETLAIKSTGPLTIQIGESEVDVTSLRHKDALLSALKKSARQNIILDITGMPHNTWAPLVKVGLEIDPSLKVVYTEPDKYRQAVAPREDEFFDLSQKIVGVSPIPLFTKLSEFDEQETRFIALLGFEGARFKFLLNEVQPKSENIFPIIGAPGFKIEYPFIAIQCNGEALQTWNAHRNLRFASSNCPFSAFYEIDDIVSNGAKSHNKLGLVGTKPHALGAVLAALMMEASIELVYDQAVRRQGRTSGIGKIHLYHIGRFISDSTRPQQIAS